MFRKSRTQSVLDQASDFAEDLAAKIQPHVESALDQLQALSEEAKDKAGPAVSDARDRVVEGAGSVADTARDRYKKDVLPAVAAAAATAQERIEPYRDEAVRRGLATQAALKGEVDPPSKGGRMKKLLLVGGAVGLGAFVFKKLRGDNSDGWQQSYTPAPPPPAPARPAPVTSDASAKVAGDPLSDSSFGDKAQDASANRPPAPAGDDVAGSSPDEAAADAAEAPHEVTTPDSPAQTVDVSEVEDPKP